MSANPKVSIIVPVYNVEKYLANCLDTLVKQTLKDIEIICINDGSKDSSPEILKCYAQKDSRIKIIDKQNAGLSAARNDGLKVASGEFVGYVDSDDWVDLNFYEKLYTAAKKYDAEIASGNIIRCGNRAVKYKVKFEKEELITDSIEKLKAAKIPKYNYVWNKIYKRESLIALDLLFPDGRLYEDICWSIKAVYYLNGLVTVPECAYYYRRNPFSIVSTKSPKHEEDARQSEKEMIEFAEEKNLTCILNGLKLVRRERIKFCGLNILKIFHYYPNTTKYTLFGLIPVLKIHGNKAAKAAEILAERS